MSDTKTCPFCAEDIKAEARLCKFCRSDLSVPVHSASVGPISTEAKSQKALGAVTGVVGGIGCGIWIIVLGVFLTMTGIGAIIGIPMIFAGLLAPVITPFVSASQVSGECPYCGKVLRGLASKGAVTCKYCRKRVVISKGKFVRVD